MFTSNLFAGLSASIPTAYMQWYIIVMVLLVMGGTILDMLHKKSAKYFFENAKKAQKSAKREVSGGEKISMATAVLVNEVLTSGEFDNPRRRISHLLTMWGTIIFIVTTALMVFSPESTSTLLPQLWHIGAIMMVVGTYWFWLAIRADVAAEGLPIFRFERSDLFIVSLMATSTFALVWSYTGGGVTVSFVLFILSSTMLFGSVYWSKFAHMFFKPAAAFQKRVIMADGGRENLPPDYDLTSPEVHAKFPDVPQYMGKNPPNMGLCIKAERANHY